MCVEPIRLAKRENMMRLNQVVLLKRVLSISFLLWSIGCFGISGFVIIICFALLFICASANC